MASKSYQALLAQLISVDQLIAIHGKLQKGRGRRHEQEALHKAGVVMTVAAWQAYVERIVAETLDAIARDIRDPAAAPPSPLWARQTFLMRRSAIEIQLKKFNTPNSDNIRDLLVSALGFHPWPNWTWQQGPRQWNEKTTRKRTEDWLRVSLRASTR